MAAISRTSNASVDRINYLNIALMLASGALALAFPFALFLFSYAVLGPLHYLTEISWLHDRKYFTKGKHDHFLLGVLSLAVTILVVGTVAMPSTVSVLVVYLTFVSAGVFALTPSWKERIGLIGCSALFVPILLNQGLVAVIFGLLLPTIIHVFLFTGMFILAGTIKQKSVSGALSLGTFAVVSAALLLWHPSFAAHPLPGGYVHSAYGEAGDPAPKGFLTVNYVLLRMLAPGSFPTAGATVDAVDAFLYGHPIARAVMAFIAFSYTYHYLNWFSKTSVIGWHKVPKKRLLAVLVIWGASLGLYAADYGLGARWLYFLSFLHVVLELPLNHVTFRAILSALKPVRHIPI